MSNIKPNIILRTFLPWELQLELAYYLDFDSVLVFYPNEDANFWQKKAELYLNISKECFLRKDLYYHKHDDLGDSSGRYLYFLTQRANEFKKSFPLSSTYLNFNHTLCNSGLLVRIAAEQNNIEMLENILKFKMGIITSAYLYHYYYGIMKFIDKQQLFINNIGLTQNSYNGALAGSIEYNNIECYNHLKTNYKTYYQEALKTNQIGLFEAIFRGSHSHYFGLLKDICQINIGQTPKNYCQSIIKYANLEKIKAAKKILIVLIPQHGIKIKRLDFEIVKYFVEELKGQCDFKGMISSPFDIPDNLLSYLLDEIKIEINLDIMLLIINGGRINLFLKVFKRGNLQLDENAIVKMFSSLIAHNQKLDIIKNIFENNFDIIEKLIKNKSPVQTLAKKIFNHSNNKRYPFERFEMPREISDYLGELIYSNTKRKLPHRETKKQKI